MKTHLEKSTRVIFRYWPKAGDVIALFPALAGDNDPGTCSSYQTIGQHGAASVRLMAETKAASAEQFAPLAKELERIGYKLQIASRFTRADYLARKQQINR